MRAVHAQRRITPWIAALAMLLTSLVPARSQALVSATGPGTHWTEICTSSGSKWIQSGEDGSQPAPASAHVMDDCPGCAQHTPTQGLPPATQLAALPLQLGQEVPHAFLVAPRTLHAWVRAQPRAPPLFC